MNRIVRAGGRAYSESDDLLALNNEIINIQVGSFAAAAFLHIVFFILIVLREDLSTIVPSFILAFWFYRNEISFSERPKSFIALRQMCCSLLFSTSSCDNLFARSSSRRERFSRQPILRRAKQQKDSGNWSLLAKFHRIPKFPSNEFRWKFIKASSRRRLFGLSLLCASFAVELHFFSLQRKNKFLVQYQRSVKPERMVERTNVETKRKDEIAIRNSLIWFLIRGECNNLRLFVSLRFKEFVCSRYRKKSFHRRPERSRVNQQNRISLSLINRNFWGIQWIIEWCVCLTLLSSPLKLIRPRKFEIRVWYVRLVHLRAVKPMHGICTVIRNA